MDGLRMSDWRSSKFPEWRFGFSKGWFHVFNPAHGDGERNFASLHPCEILQYCDNIPEDERIIITLMGKWGG